MKKLTLIFATSLCFSLTSKAQTYQPFPTDSAHWNVLTEYNATPISYYYNEQYELLGDTILDGQAYGKLYMNDYTGARTYIGGMREDASKNIFFYPKQTLSGGFIQAEYPSNTSELLLYSFDSLSVGSIISYPNNFDLEITGIDSILVGGEYRKRYATDHQLMFNEYWIEGIGSTKNLMSPYMHEFEWFFYTLCYEDSNTYYINSSNGEDSCTYAPNTIGIDELYELTVELQTNLISDQLVILSKETGRHNITIVDINGKWVGSTSLTTNSPINVKFLNAGMYIAIIEHQNKQKRIRFIKE